MSEVDFNCDCEDSSSYETLATLRRRMMLRLGYAAQADNPPPGMSALLDDFLQSAQIQLYDQNPSIRTTRFYRWTMTPGVRYYGIPDNDTQTDFTDVTCGKHLAQQGTILWVGLEDLNGAWLPLIQGIPPEYYTMSPQQGIPSYYEIRSCIELFPAPNAAYKLWIKGQFELEPFVANTDRTTIQSDLVFLLALGNAKAHYGQRDAKLVLDQAFGALLGAKAKMHQTARYVPGAVQIPNWVQPRMISFLP